MIENDKSKLKYHSPQCLFRKIVGTDAAIYVDSFFSVINIVPLRLTG